MPTQQLDDRHWICGAAERLAQASYAFAELRGLLAGGNRTATAASDDGAVAWGAFAASWQDLPPDTYMADGGHYRQRRYASFTAEPGAAPRLNAHRPHYQTRNYNPLNGGIDRWFAPITRPTIESSVLVKALETARAVFERSAGTAERWDIEVHQFRITAGDGISGLPTPEGLHSDGVDYVFMMLIDRRNINGGVTHIARGDGAPIATLELKQPGDAVFLDDRKTRHGVSPIEPDDANDAAYRDMLVVTFRGLSSDR